MHTTRKVLAGVFFVATLALGIYATASGTGSPRPGRDAQPKTFLIEDEIEGGRPADAGNRRSDV